MRFAQRVISDNVDDEIAFAGVDELVRLTWFEDERVTSFDRIPPSWRTVPSPEMT